MDSPHLRNCLLLIHEVVRRDLTWIIVPWLKATSFLLLLTVCHRNLSNLVPICLAGSQGFPIFLKSGQSIPNPCDAVPSYIVLSYRHLTKNQIQARSIFDLADNDPNQEHGCGMQRCLDFLEGPFHTLWSDGLFGMISQAPTLVSFSLWADQKSPMVPKKVIECQRRISY